MTTRNRMRTVFTLAFVAMGIVGFTAVRQVSAAELTHDAVAEVWHQDLGGTFNVSVYPGKASYSGKAGAVTGVFGDGTVLDYRFFTSPGNVFGSYADGGGKIVGTATATNSNGDGEDWADVWTTNDPGTDFVGGAAANFTVDTLARSQGVVGTIDISKMASGTLYFTYGSYQSVNTVNLTMSGAGQPDIVAGHTEDPPGRNIVWISTFTFDGAAAYDTITYTYTNADTDGSRARFLGVIVDGVIDANIPSVDAGVDMITWSGQAVQLDPNIVEAEGSDWTNLTYAWTADPCDGVVFSDPGIEAPTVTITKMPVLVPFVTNGGFEDPVLAEDGYTWQNVPGWTPIGHADDDEGVGVWNTTIADFDPLIAPEGENVLYTEYVVGGVGGVAQVLDAEFAADTAYMLTVDVGNSDYYYFSGYKVQLLAGGTVIAEDNDTLWPASKLWATSTVAYTYNPADAALVGQPLE